MILMSYEMGNPGNCSSRAENGILMCEGLLVKLLLMILTEVSHVTTCFTASGEIALLFVMLVAC